MLIERIGFFTLGRKRKGKVKFIKEVGSSSSGFLGCGGANVNIAFSSSQAEADGSHGVMSHPLLTVIKQRILVKVLCWCWTLLSFFTREWGLLLREEKWICFPFKLL